MRFYSLCLLVSCSVAMVAIAFPAHHVHAQGGSVSFGSQRPFVIAVIPVVGRNGAVGGVEVAANGVLDRVQVDRNQTLADARAAATKGLSADVRRRSPLRKVSLRKLEAALIAHAKSGKPVAAEMLYLAGLQRIEYVFVYPESRDIVIAGPAEGWTVRQGEVVGATNGVATLQLDDLLDALQSAEAAASADGITCSIDPTTKGLARLQRALRSRRNSWDEAAVKALEETLGTQDVTLTGIRPTSHFARVMVSADYLMKRLAMGLDESPTPNLSSYMTMLRDDASSSKLAAPRWWLATDYQPVERSPDGLAWHLQGAAVKAMSEDGYLRTNGEVVNAGRAAPLAKKWADDFTSNYDALAHELPVFAQLRGCIDMAVVAALITKERLQERADCPLLALTDAKKMTGAQYAVPKTVASRASLVRGRKGWIVSVSGGVDLNTWSELDDVKTVQQLATTRKGAYRSTDAWWWD